VKKQFVLLALLLVFAMVFSGCGRLTVQGQPVENGLMQSVPFSADGLIHFCCTEGEVQLEKLLILEA